MPQRRKMSAFISVWEPRTIWVIAQRLIQRPVLTLTSSKQAQGKIQFLKAPCCAAIQRGFANFQVRRRLVGRKAFYLLGTTPWCPTATPPYPWGIFSPVGNTVTITCFSATPWGRQEPSGALSARQSRAPHSLS